MVHGALRSRQPDHELPGAAVPPGVCRTTLSALAARQARVRDDFHEQEPGKILHEVRFGELTAVGVRPHSPYFGTADATPLFLILLEEYHRCSGDDDLIRELEPNARRPGLDRGQRGRRRRRVRRVPTAQPGHRPDQPVLERQLGLDPVRRRHPCAAADRHLRDPGLCLRRATALGAPRARRLGRPSAGRPTRAARRRPPHEVSA
jgi:hypothetical protein